jgi:PAS domain-containing protein
MDFPFSLADWMPLIDWAAFGELPAIVTAAVLSAVTTLMLVLGLNPGGLVPGLIRGRPREGAAPAEVSDCEFLIQGSSVKPLTEPARALLGGLDPKSGRLSALTSYLERGYPGFRADLEGLILYGTGFRHHCQREDGSAYELAGWPREGAAHLAIRAASEDARALRGARGALERAETEGALLRELLDRAPMMAWITGADGVVTWANLPYRDRFVSAEAPPHETRGPSAFAHGIEDVPLTARGEFARRRVAVPCSGGPEQEWFAVSEAPRGDGGAIGFALDANDLVAAEATLRRFIETLTETFAHLPIGLAVFDKNRRLGLFNPALTELVKIDAVWLAGRPSLRDFLERLRETRQMPDQKDFTSWRRKLSELEKGAREGTYEENWVLPSGKIFHVTGRPHPQGAVAFLFEDISTTIMLERRYRSEVEISQATLDRVSEAVAVFDASGELVFVNSAFETLWGLGPMDRLRGPGIAEMARICAERCRPGTVWTRVTEFATGAEERATWTDRVTLIDGRALHLLVAPLPDAASLIVFRDLVPERAVSGPAPDEAALIGASALEQLRMPAERAVRQLTAAIPAAPTPEAFQALTVAARELRDGLSRTEGLGTLDTEGAGPLPLLARALERRGITLEIAGDPLDWSGTPRHLGLSLGLAAADLAGPGGTVLLFRDAEGLRAEIPAATGAPEGLAWTVARRMAEEAGGSLDATWTQDHAALALRLPPAPAEVDVPAAATPRVRAAEA